LAAARAQDPAGEKIREGRQVMRSKSGKIPGLCLFTGGGLCDVGMRDVVEFVSGVEYDPAIAAHATLALGHEVICASVCDVDYKRWRGMVDYLHASPPCFPAGTMILTNAGIVPIEDVRPGDEVLTHTGRYIAVESNSERESETITLSGVGHYGIETTPDHPFYMVSSKRIYDSWTECRKLGKKRGATRVFSTPEWVPAKDSVGKYWLSHSSYPSIGIPEIEYEKMEHLLRCVTFNAEFFWVVGAWVGNGWTRYKDEEEGKKSRGEVLICDSHDKIEALSQRVCDAGLPFYTSVMPTATRLSISSRPLARWLLKHFGEFSYGKTIPAWLLGVDAELRTAFLSGYEFTDGYKESPRHAGTIPRTTATTVSRRLQVGMKMLTESLGYTYSAFKYTPAKTRVIEGREVNQRTQYLMGWSKSNRLSRQVGSYQAGVVRKSEPAAENQKVYCLTVPVDHSYVADGIIVHNCTNASVANANAGETDMDERLGAAVCRAICDILPTFFTLENVAGYAAFTAFQDILQCLEANGYKVHWRVYDSADFGVPQHRKRIMLRARRDGKPLPEVKPTHCNPKERGASSLQPKLFDMEMDLPAWRGWHEAVADLLPDCPDTQLAPWQQKRLAAQYGENWLEKLTGSVIVRRHVSEWTEQVVSDVCPAPTASSNEAGRMRAVLVESQGCADTRPPTLRVGGEPSWTVRTNRQTEIRAVLVGTQGYKGEVQNVDGQEPAPTPNTTSGAGAYRALLVGGVPTNHGDYIRPRETVPPSPTVSVFGAGSRAILPCRIVALTPRCLARFQSVPDDYPLPANKSLATRIIGNGIPCAFARAIFGGMLADELESSYR
jgi:site-specific DNA-cytosine methylase